MTYTLKIRFEGLCLLVQQKSSGRLHAILPRSANHVTRAIKGEPPTEKSYPFSGIVDWSACAKGGASPVKLIEAGALPLSATTGGYVASTLLDGDLPDKAAARLILPFPTTDPVLDVHHVRARVDYPAGGMTAHDLDAPVAGLLQLTYTMTAPVAIGYHSISTDETVRIVNAPVAMGSATHRAGSQLGHVHGYDTLISGAKAKPEFTTTEPYSAGKISIFWVDPVMCTIGSGCPEDDPKCGGA